MRTNQILLLLGLTFSIGINAQETIADEGAWCWFADPRALHYENADRSIDMTWIGYIDVHGNIKATQIDYLRNRQTEVLVRSNFQPDDHDNPTFLVLPDERVMIFYSRHTDEPAFYYRITETPGDLETLGPEGKITMSDNTTYPSPFILSEDPTHFYLCWRGINWHPTIARFEIPGNESVIEPDWGPYQIVQSTGARPYAKYTSNGRDKIYICYTTGHPDNEEPNWIYCNVIHVPTGGGEPTLEDMAGGQLSMISSGVFNVNKTSSYAASYPATIVDSPSSYRDWVWQIMLDGEENPRISMVRISSDKSQHEYYLAKWTGENWQITDLCSGGGKFHLSNTEYCYSGGMALDPSDPNIVYVSKPVAGAAGEIFEICKYKIGEDGAAVMESTVTQDSEKGNVRPYILGDEREEHLNKLWMRGDYYYWMVNKNYPLGYPTSIIGDWQTAGAISARNGDFDPQFSDAEGVGDAWSLSFICSLPEDEYYGEMVSSGSFSFGIDKEETAPYLIVGGEKSISSCQYYTADDWALYSSGTNGDYYPTTISSCRFTLTCDGSRLILYRDGMYEMSSDCAGLGLGLAGATFSSNASDVQVISGALLPMEVQALMRYNAIQEVSVPQTVHTDLVLPSRVGTTQVTWSSSNPEILTADGFFTAPETAQEVTLTASAGGLTRDFKVTALPRDLAASLLASYQFEPEDKSISAEGVATVADRSGHGRDMAIMGSAVVDGTLNLRANTAGGFGTNGYGVALADLLDSLRSYTVMVDVNASSLASQPRIYDWGFSSGSSVFLRAEALSAGIKYDGGTTTMTTASTSLAENVACNLAVTFEARDHLTRIYVDGTLVAEGTENTREPYELAQLAACDRNYVGRTQWWDTSYAADNVDFQGTIDNLRVYDIALTNAEIDDILGIEVADEALNVDVSEVIENRGFEGDYGPLADSGAASDRAIYSPEGWVVAYTDRNEWDASIVTSADLLNDEFETVPVCAGGASYRVRQNWGSSTIGLSQELGTLAAGVYELGASIWSSGSGGRAEIYAEVDGSETVGGPLNADMSAWQTAGVDFIVSGFDPVSIGLRAVHESNGSVKFIGFDDVKLYDITTNGTPAQLVALLETMTPGGQLLLSSMPDDEDLATALADAGNASASDGQATLYSLYVNLRKAIEDAWDEYTAVQAPLSDAAPSQLYDLSGRALTLPLPRQIYIRAGRKVVSEP